MQRLTYQQAYDKIIQAYFRDEIQPFKGEFCFCGTLNNNSASWVLFGYTEKYAYDQEEFFKMELALYTGLTKAGLVLFAGNHRICNANQCENWEVVHKHPLYEEALFEGMSLALEVLKQIHKERGEDVDGVPEFTKRNLKTETI